MRRAPQVSKFRIWVGTLSWKPQHLNEDPNLEYSKLTRRDYERACKLTNTCSNANGDKFSLLLICLSWYSLLNMPFWDISYSNVLSKLFTISITGYSLHLASVMFVLGLFMDLFNSRLCINYVKWWLVLDIAHLWSFPNSFTLVRLGSWFISYSLLGYFSKF